MFDRMSPTGSLSKLRLSSIQIFLPSASPTDLLLPQLISGALRIADAEKIVGRAV